MPFFLFLLLFVLSGVCLAQPSDDVTTDPPRTVGVRQAQELRLWNTWSRRPTREIVLTSAMRVEGLSKLWSAAKLAFAYFDRIPALDWDSLYQATLPIVEAPQSPVEYYRTLQSVAARLEDGSTRVIVPWELRDSLEIYPPIVTRPVGERVVVVRVFDAEIRDQGVVAGVELLEIDGVPVVEYGARRVMPYVAASTMQGRLSRTYERALLAGSSGDSVTLTFARPDGSTFTGRYARNWNEEPLFSMDRSVYGEILDGNIGYLRLNTFYDEYLPDYVARQFAPLIGTDALVIDLRENEEGAVDAALEILALFTSGRALASDDGMPLADSRRPVVDGVTGAEAPGVERTALSTLPAYNRPIVVLTSPRTRMAAENFIAAFRDAGRGKVVGERTAGASGETRYVGLPADGLLELCVSRDRNADGSTFNGIGIEPDIEVTPGIDDIRSGADPVLQAALELLHKRLVH